MEALRASIDVGDTIPTIAEGQPNHIVAIDEDGVVIETRASKAKDIGPQRVDAWMLNTAWHHLRRHRSLTNADALSPEGLNIKRSSAVCALLAQLPDVRVVSVRPIRLEMD